MMKVVVNSLIVLCLLCFECSKSDDSYEQAKIELENYIHNASKYINPRYRPLYHVAPPVGWMNDPNGFSYHNGTFHLFYQFYPYDSVSGPKHWGHSSSPDLVDWTTLPTALIPEKEQCFSGSAITQGDQLVLMYTGHVVTSNDESSYNESQYLAFSADAVNFTKYEGNPVIAASPNNSADFRDPKVWKHGDDYYVIIGSKTSDDRGRVLLYKSQDLIDWKFLTILGESNGTLGYMWECPDFFELDGKFVLLISPQGIEPQGDRYKNTYQNGYILGSYDYETNEFVPEVPFQELDYGHDIYAATTTEANGIRYLVAWCAMWETPHPEEVDGWAGTMTLFKELSIKNNRILMKPAADIVKLRKNRPVNALIGLNDELKFGKAVELLIDSDLCEKMDLYLEGREGGGNVSLRWDPEVGKVVVDRNGDVRQVEWSPIGSHTWRLFLDASSLELFCGEGEVVFSTRVYPLGGWKLTNKTPQRVKIRSFNLRRSVPK